MAVTVNNGTQTPVVGAETTIATIAGGPFDNVSVYFTGGTGGAGGAIGVNLYATVNAVVSLVGSAQVQGTSVGTLIEFPDTSNGATGTTSQSSNQNTSFIVDAGAATYTVKVIDLSTVPIPPGGSARAACTVTLAGVNSSDTAVNAAVTGAFGGLAAGATGSCAVQAGYAVQMDVAVSQGNTLQATVTVTADCGPGSVSAIVKSQPYTGVGGAGLFAIFRNLHLPVATEYTVSLTNNGAVAGTWAVSSMTYSGVTGGGGGAIVLAGEVAGPSNANVVTGPFSQASLKWAAAVLGASLGTNVANATFILAADANAPVMQLAGGVQGGVALGTHLALVGQIRTTSGWLWNSRRSDNAADVQTLQDDGAGNLSQGSGYSTATYNATSINILPATQLALETITAFFDATTIQYRDAAHANTMLMSNAGAGVTSMQFAAAVTAVNITWAASAGAAGTMSITGQPGGGAAADGGPLALAGGAHAGASKADGSVRITTPANMGCLSIAAASPLNLTNAQSNTNVFLFTGAPPGGWTVNFLREIADTSLIFVKNTSTQTMTVAFLTGGTVTVATNTSALIASDGANLQKIMTAT